MALCLVFKAHCDATAPGFNFSIRLPCIMPIEKTNYEIIPVVYMIAGKKHQRYFRFKIAILVERLQMPSVV